MTRPGVGLPAACASPARARHTHEDRPESDAAELLRELGYHERLGGGGFYALWEPA